MARQVDETVLEAGHALRQARRDMGYTGAQIQQITRDNGYEVPQSQVSRIERGAIRKPPAPDLIAIATALKLNPAEVLKSFGVPIGGFTAEAVDARLRRAHQVAMALPEASREKFLNWIDFATTQAMAEMVPAAR